LFKNRLGIAITLLAYINCLRLLWDNFKYVLFVSFDTGWIIRTGQYILLTYGAPHADTFSWTYSGRPFVAYQWLAEVLAAVLYQSGGLWTVGLCFALIAGFTFLFILPLLWIVRGIPPAIPYLVLMLVLSPHWFNVRPQVFSYLFLLLFIYLLEHYRTTQNSQKLWMLVALSVLWANVHLFWSIGLLLIAIYLVCDLWRSRNIKGAASPLLLVLTLSAVAITINPYGPEIYHYLWTFLNKSQFMGMNEVKPLWNMPTAGIILAFFAIAWQMLINKRRSMSAEAFIVCAAATISAVLVRRYGSLAVVLVWPYFGFALATIEWKQYTWAPLLKIKHFAALAAAALVLPAILWYCGCSSEKSARAIYSESSIDGLKLAETYLTKKDRLFNDPPTGDWLILFTDIPVYIDTRYDMYPKVFCEDTFACLWAAPKTLDYIKGHGATHILVQKEFEPINKLLDRSPDWLLIFDQGRVSFWGQNTQDEIERMAKMQLTDSQIAGAKIPPAIIERTIKRRLQNARNQLMKSPH